MRVSVLCDTCLRASLLNAHKDVLRKQDRARDM